MQKVTNKEFRQTKEITLPISGVTIDTYSSILIGDLGNVDLGKGGLDTNLEIIAKVIREWNFYDKEEDEKPYEISVENIKKLPVPDFEFLIKELEVFATQQKKS